jgi:hypothetical protein
MVAKKRPGTFKKGWKGGPGRPKGSKNKLSEAFITALCADFMENGKGAIDRLQENSPGEYLRVIASVLPKDINLDQTVEHTVINAQPEMSVTDWQEKHYTKPTVN